MGPGERKVWFLLLVALWIVFVILCLHTMGDATCSANQPC